MASNIEVRAMSPSTSVVYQYGVRLDTNREDLPEVLANQFALAHRFYNELIALSREVLGNVRAMLEEKDPDIKRLRLRQEDLYDQRRAARANDDRDTFAVLTKEVQVVNREMAQRLFEARREHKELVVPFLLDVSTTKSESRAYALRTAYVNQGLYWATAGATMRAFSTAWKKQWPRMKEPHFRRAAERDRRVLTDQMNDRSGGVTQAELHSGRYRFWVAEPQAAGAGKYLPFRMRVGPAGFDLTGSIQWHRPLPAGATITEVRLVEQRIARQRKYYLQLQLRVPALATSESRQTGRVAGLALGWYRDGDTRRVGAINETSRSEAAEVIRLPADILTDLERVDEWASERDKARDAAVAQLRVQQLDNVPQLLAERLVDLLRLPTQHISSARVAWVVLLWRDGYPGFAPETLAVLEAWRKSDATLWERIAHTRRRALNRRRAFYLSLDAQWARRYDTLMLQDLDLARMAAIKDEATGEHNELGAKARHGRYVAALSELEAACVRAMQKSGGQVVVVNDVDTTKCSHCGETAAELTTAIVAKCPGCGEVLEKRTNTATLLRTYYDERDDEIAAALERAALERQQSLVKQQIQKQKRSEARAAAAAVRREAKGAA